MPSDILNTKMDAVASVITAYVLIMPVDAVDMAAKLIPAALASIYWIVRLIEQSKKQTPPNQ